MGRPHRTDNGELESIESSLSRGVPCGDNQWQSDKIRKYGLESILRKRGRPRKGS